jgi:muramoyltetrapeptide carboxypeptidase
MKDHKDSFGAEALEIISRNLAGLNIPMAYGFSLGQEKINLPVDCGIAADLDVSPIGVKLRFPL